MFHDSRRGRFFIRRSLENQKKRAPFRGPLLVGGLRCLGVEGPQTFEKRLRLATAQLDAELVGIVDRDLGSLARALAVCAVGFQHVEFRIFSGIVHVRDDILRDIVQARASVGDARCLISQCSAALQGLNHVSVAHVAGCCGVLNAASAASKLGNADCVKDGRVKLCRSHSGYTFRFLFRKLFF